MGVYIRQDSPFYWMVLERKGRKPLRESTGVPRLHSFPAQVKELRRQAEAIYLSRMNELLRADLLEAPTVMPPLRSPVERRGLSRSANGWCYVYFVQRGDQIKVGSAVEIPSRMKTLQTAHSAPLTLLAAVPGHVLIEKAIHRKFGHLRKSGEWFSADAELLAFIDALRSGANPIALLW